MLHEAGWAHNDIQKPNIMVASDGLPRLIDFGETTRADSLRILNDNDRLENLFRESVMDINAIRRSRISERSRMRSPRSPLDRELQSALFGSPASPISQVKRMRFEDLE